MRSAWRCVIAAAAWRDAPEMRLIVGLGNPGVEYAWTPHNLGFLAVDAIAERAGIRVERPEAKSLVGLGPVRGAGRGPGQAADDDESERPGGAGSAAAPGVRPGRFDRAVRRRGAALGHAAHSGTGHGRRP